MTKLHELLGQYFDAGVSEGQENRNHDTIDCIAQTTLDSIMAHVTNLLELERVKCANVLVMTNQEIRLMAGELSVNEMRSVQAVLSNRQSTIRNIE